MTDNYNTNVTMVYDDKSIESIKSNDNHNPQSPFPLPVHYSNRISFPRQGKGSQGNLPNAPLRIGIAPRRQ
jgi:hypothetical protein